MTLKIDNVKLLKERLAKLGIYEGVHYELEQL
jgi:hypothetical protein